MKTECVNLSLSLLFWIAVCSLYSNRLMKENGKCRFVQALRSLQAINSVKWIPKKCSCLLKSWWKFKLIQNLILMILICLLNLVLFSLFAKQWVEDYCVVNSLGKHMENMNARLFLEYSVRCWFTTCQHRQTTNPTVCETPTDITANIIH